MFNSDSEDDFLSDVLEEEGDDEGFLSDALDESENGHDQTATYEPSGESGQVKYQPEVFYHSSEKMPELKDESVHLAVTSPPYNAGWEYGSVDDEMPYVEGYLSMLARVFKEVHRVLVPGGRFCVNVPTLLRAGEEGGYPIAADITKMMVSAGDAFVYFGQLEENSLDVDAITELQTECDWIIREQISWDKGFNTDGLAPNGSFPRPWGVLLNNMHETILVFQKPGDRSYDDMPDERIENSKIEKWSSDLCDDCWDIHPESFDFRFTEDEDVPVFPEEIPKRCIALWSYEGDTVLEPFAGRGTTLKMAKQMNRDSVGYELREELQQDIEHYVGIGQQSLW